MPDSVLLQLSEKLAQLAPLDNDDHAAILALPHAVRTFAPQSFIVREGDAGEQCCFVQSGFVARHKVIADGSRQIVGIHMAGDIVNLQNAVLKIADHSVQALTNVDLLCIPARAIMALAAKHPNVAVAMWLDSMIDGAIFREWITNVGQRDASARTAHLLCEFAIRQEQAGLGSRTNYEFPLTQEQIGDALGLTAVHVNRTLRALAASGLIERDKRTVTIADWNALQRAAGFDPTYLYLETNIGGEPAARKSS